MAIDSWINLLAAGLRGLRGLDGAAQEMRGGHDVAVTRGPLARGGALGTRRAYQCVCRNAVYFHNDRCLSCRTELGFDPERLTLVGLKPIDTAGNYALVVPAGRPVLQGGSAAAKGVISPVPPLVRRCANHASAAGCNWLVASAEGSRYCIACRLNRTIPDQSEAANREAWRRIESAKRRLVSQLLALRLPVRSRLDEDPARGLMFDFLVQQPGAARLTTGHRNGLITLDVAEADDAHREALRSALGEPYRTLLGHLRHEVGHYYWDRLVRDSPKLASFRTLFGDERQDYALALQRHYAQGPAPDWSRRCVSAYASAHPWEEWAETWAHYLHMVDTVDTAQSFGLDASDVQVQVQAFHLADLWQPQARDASAFLAFLNNWMALTQVLNELSRSMGQADFYPFVLPVAAVAKLQFVHGVVQDAR